MTKIKPTLIVLLLLPIYTYAGINTPPTADAGTDETYETLQNISLDGSGSDANDINQVLTYEWEQLSGINVTLSATDIEFPEFEAPKLNPKDSSIELIFSLIVNDGIEDSAADTVVITIEPYPETEPVFNTVVLNYFVDPSDDRESLGDLLFTPDGSQAHMLVGSESSTSRVMIADVFRDADQNVTGFGSWNELFAVENMDTGLEYANNSNTIFVYREDVGIVQRTPVGDLETYLVQNYNAEYGGLAVVPEQYNNSGNIIKSEYENGRLFLHAVTDDNDGTFTISPGSMVSQLPFDSSGDIQYIGSGLLANHIAVAHYSEEATSVYLIAVDSITGLPAMNPEITVLLQNISGAWGLTIDPITGHLWAIDYSNDMLIQVILDELIFKDGFGTQPVPI